MGGQTENRSADEQYGKYLRRKSAGKSGDEVEKLLYPHQHHTEQKRHSGKEIAAGNDPCFVNGMYQSDAEHRRGKSGRQYPQFRTVQTVAADEVNH